MCEIRTISKVYIDYFLKREKTRKKKTKKNLKKKRTFTYKKFEWQLHECEHRKSRCIFRK